MNEVILTKNESKLLKMTGQKSYDNQIKLFNQFLDYRNINFETVKEYMNEQFSKCMKGQKSFSSLIVVKSALKKSITKTFDKESHNILFLASLDKFFNEIKIPKQDSKIHKEKTLDEIEIRDLIINSPKRIGIIIETLYKTGLRISELINIKLSDCERINKTTYIKILGKGKKLRRIFIPTDLFEEIRTLYNSKLSLFETLENKPFSRIYLAREIRKHGRKILNKNIHPHTFRHSFSTDLLINKNKSLKAVSSYLGHSSTSITADLYIHDELDPEDLFDFQD